MTCMCKSMVMPTLHSMSFFLSFLFFFLFPFSGGVFILTLTVRRFAKQGILDFRFVTCKSFEVNPPSPLPGDESMLRLEKFVVFFFSVRYEERYFVGEAKI